ncbi:DUF1329 domain-containing protein [Solimonas sp. K1W22B-7]|uniref:DUF1329 domain-containing protein n=1 Tax=Solimonas sp. K1W22B-7 TaxID=2303331 RepID=UPI000E334E14|nr:DUF1329 domain-containing protein [Solimonas sp. K1W22B-7]AXQ28311.1 DUF1329 domain-containing protein [Solimonas sp. K1W22B-7]
MQYTQFKALALAGFAAAAFSLSPSVLAKVPAAEAAKLGQELTPVGAEKGPNKDGSIPAWTPAAQRGALKGEFPNDAKIDAEKALFTITKANMEQYAAKLTEGHKKLLKTYDSYKMNVYPSHRVVNFPEAILKATAENAVNCEMVGTDTPDNCKLGFPFPIPKTGAEPIWNHKMKWRGEAQTRFNNQMIVQPNGQFQLTKIIEDVTFGYASIKSPVPVTKNSGEFLKYLSKTVEPPRMAGTFILVHEKAGTGAEGRAAWLYSPGLKRIRRAPTVCCDNPYEGTDGHQFYDQVDMFNGVLERYNWKLVGKKEMFIPYNSNKISGNKLKYKDLAKPKHLNPDLPRYELHRVWVVEADLKQGTSHTFKKRRFYIDEDSWNIVAVDDYDKRDELYQFQEGHLIFAYNILAATTVPEVIYHFTSGRYFVTAAFNEDKPNDVSVSFKDDYFSASSVQKMTTK